ncbi:tRNA (cytosine(72)-C(5))-methyltransferase NSUN6 [Ischnura elegans]|uniref:tRNA (cytosine(72)-C(5))-methyltransferase NSUN6 n=1 Tax=Ischnura elegans TaxID=197161 RepID=UPI001ED88670|nr:tRNA (cytosine(72)-C(5))-methyltransferase NSUN6 [Ischnura elegans]
MGPESVPLYHSSGVVEYLKSNISSDSLPDYLEWLYKAPKYTTYRLNNRTISADEAKTKLKSVLEDGEHTYSESLPDLFVHPLIRDVIVLGPRKTPAVQSAPYGKDVIVDSICGAAVLRGAHVYAPGVLGMPAGIKKGDEVNILADLEAGCRKGLKMEYAGKIVFIAKGISLMTRKELFADNCITSGIAIEVKSTTSCCTCLPANNPLVDDLSSMLLLQNLPSVICGWALNPQPGQIVLDACAAPGNKTTHLASLMNNQGTIVALDKTPSKVNLIKKNCEKRGASNVQAYAFDTTKAVVECGDIVVKCAQSGPPPYSPNSFDKVLLDAPCSALGQRPQLANWTSVSQLKSYPALQRKLFKSAYSLVRNGGQILYSTCTITLAENEEIVSWALESFPNLSLQELSPRVGGCGGKGWPVKGLTPEQQAKLLRFGPPMAEIPDGCAPCDTDTVGFFIALFHKNG